MERSSEVPGRPDLPAPAGPPPRGQAAVITAALSIGLLLMGVQLWLLTVALDLYMAGVRDALWLPALASAAIFGGGLLVLWLLRRRPSLPPRVGPLPEPPGFRNLRGAPGGGRAERPERQEPAEGGGGT